MGANDRAVDGSILEVNDVGHPMTQSWPNSLLTPSIEALVNTVPVAIPVGQFSPLRSGFIDPQYRFNESATLIFLADVNPRHRPQFTQQALPL